MKTRVRVTSLLHDAWTILVETARARTTIPYGQLAERLRGLEHRVVAQNLGSRVLTPLHDQVTAPRGWPDISAVAVRTDSVLRRDGPYPGDEWWRSHGRRGPTPRPSSEELAVWRRELTACYQFDWPDSPWDDTIVSTEGTLSGRARINGTRIGVSDVWLAYLRALDEVAVPRILKDFSHLKEEQVRAALDYARRHAQEIEQELEEEEKASEDSLRLG